MTSNRFFMPWGIDHVADQLEEAADTLRRLPKVDWKARLTYWPEVLRDAAVALEEKTACRPAAPSPAAIDRMDEALAWLLPLTLEQRRLLWARACGISWRQLAGMDGRSHVTLRKRWKETLEGIVQRLQLPANTRLPCNGA
jgi:hypothetical protein